jgi:hypothetical protein
MAHLPLVCCDGGATPHHVGTSGTASIFGCCWCTRHKDLKSIVKSDVQSDDAHTLSLIGTERTFENTRLVMAAFEERLKEEMRMNKAKYCAKIQKRGGDMSYSDWSSLGSSFTL